MVESTLKGGLESTPDHYKRAAGQLPPLADVFNADPMRAVLGFNPASHEEGKLTLFNLRVDGNPLIQKANYAVNGKEGGQTPEERKKEKEQALFNQIVRLQQQLAEQLYQINKKIEETDKKIKETQTRLDLLLLEKEELHRTGKKIDDHLGGVQLLETDADRKKFKDEQVQKLLREYERRTGKTVDVNDEHAVNEALREMQKIDLPNEKIKVEKEIRKEEKELTDHSKEREKLEKDKKLLESSDAKLAAATASGDSNRIKEVQQEITKTIKLDLAEENFGFSDLTTTIDDLPAPIAQREFISENNKAEKISLNISVASNIDQKVGDVSIKNDFNGQSMTQEAIQPTNMAQERNFVTKIQSQLS